MGRPARRRLPTRPSFHCIHEPEAPTSSATTRRRLQQLRVLASVGVEVVRECGGRERCDRGLWVDTTLTAQGGVEPGSADAARPYQRQGLRLLQEPQLVRAGETLSVMVRRCAGGTRLELDVLP